MPLWQKAECVCHVRGFEKVLSGGTVFTIRTTDNFAFAADSAHREKSFCWVASLQREVFGNLRSSSFFFSNWSS